MNTKQLEQTVADLQAALDKAKKELEEAKETTWPKVGDVYYVVSDCGCVDSVEFYNCEYDLNLISIGNCFKTREEAESEVFARKVIQELKQCEGVKKFEVSTDNYCVLVDLECNTIARDFWISDVNGFAQVYFDSRGSVLNAIQKVGSERILKAAKWLACGEVVK